LGLQYKIVYKKGVENKVTDGLFRRLCVSSLNGFDAELVNCYALSLCQPRCIDEVLENYAKDNSALEMVAKMMMDPSTISNFTLAGGVPRSYNHMFSSCRLHA
jgi:hypothetical protein